MDNRNLDARQPDANPNPPETGNKPPRRVLFGSVEVEEDLQSDLLTPAERQIYQGGFATLNTLLSSEMKDDQRWLLTSPNVAAAIIGIAPMIGVSGAEATEIYNAFRRANIDFADRYTFLAAGDIAYSGNLVNDEAALYVLRSNQGALGISVKETSSSQEAKQELLEAIKVLNSGEAAKPHLAHGILSGFPLNDCEYFSKHLVPSSHSGWSFQLPAQMVADFDKTFSRPITPINLDDYLPHVRGRATKEEDEELTKLRGFLIDTRDKKTNDNSETIGGYGLLWRSKAPVSDETKSHCQKILQIDRELGLLDLIRQQRRFLRYLPFGMKI